MNMKKEIAALRRMTVTELRKKHVDAGTHEHRGLAAARDIARWQHVDSATTARDG